MYCTRNVLPDLVWIGASDRRSPIFEGAYPIPNGISYNSYLLLDEKTVLFDTVDRSVAAVFFENLAHTLGGRKLDYLVVHHIEPDHAATLSDLLRRYPDVTVICNSKTSVMIQQFNGFSPEKIQLVKENESVSFGRHTFTFHMAPMVHWPEVMVSYDQTSGTLFSADAFGTFGALDGVLFADEINFDLEWLGEARRYYANIVGKYGPQVTALLNKAAALDIKYICPLHGPVWRSNTDYPVEKYSMWAAYTPETNGVLIAYASIYGGTENAASILACRLVERGIPVKMFDVSVTNPSYILAAAFQYSHLVIASPTYNNGIFVKMEDLLHDIAAHNLQKRTVAIIQNGSWAPASGKLIAAILSQLKDMTILDWPITIKSTLAAGQEKELESLADELAAGIKGQQPEAAPQPKEPEKKGFVCKICGYIYEGDVLPEDYVCPICHRPASDFQPLS